MEEGESDEGDRCSVRENGEKEERRKYVKEGGKCGTRGKNCGNGEMGVRYRAGRKKKLVQGGRWEVEGGVE